MLVHLLFHLVSATSLLARPAAHPAVHPVLRQCAKAELLRRPRSAPLVAYAQDGPYFYYSSIRNISTPDLIKNFADTAPQAVQSAVRATVGSLLGNLPDGAFDTSVTTSSEHVAHLMYNLQLTGYLFRNAEYRRSLLASFEAAESAPSIAPSGRERAASSELPRVAGTVKVQLSPSIEAEVDAASYMRELRAEVDGLRRELAASRQRSLAAPAAPARVGADESPLLGFLAALGRSDLDSLTASVSEPVLEAMRALIDTVLTDAGVRTDESLETSGQQLRELLVTQLVTGFELCELETRRELDHLVQRE